MADRIQNLYEETIEAIVFEELDKASSLWKKMNRLAKDDPRTIEAAGDLACLEGDPDRAEELYLQLESFHDDPNISRYWNY